MDRVVQMATQKDRERRYATMDDLIADLEVLIGIENRELKARSLSNAPDAYVPSTDLGREAATHIGREIR